MATVTRGSPGIGRVRRGDLPHVDFASLGADASGGSDESERLSDLISEMLSGARAARPILLRGRFRLDSAVVIDRTLITADPQTGLSPQIEIIAESPNKGQLVATHDDTALSYLGNWTDALHSFLSLRNFGLYGPSKAAGSVGLSIDKMAYGNLDNLDISGFALGMQTADVLSSTFSRLHIRENTNGIDMSIDTESAPNAITLISPVISSNDGWGLRATGGSCTTIIGGSVEGNGATATPGDTAFWGAKILNGGINGAAGVAVIGTYFEGNSGYADLWIQHDSPIANVVSGCTFNRISSTRYTTLQLLNNSGTSGAKISLSGCGFKSFGTYVPDNGRPQIGGSVDGFGDGGGNTFDGFVAVECWSPHRTLHAPVASLPSATDKHGQIISVSNGNTGGYCLAVSNGTNWLRIVPGAAVAAS